MYRSLAMAAFVLSGLAWTPLADGNASSGGWYEQPCNETDTKTIDGGCCPEFTFPAGNSSCVEMNCASELQYNCGETYNYYYFFYYYGDTGDAPICAEEPTAPAMLGANITGTVIMCTMGSAVCYALDSQPHSGSWEWVHDDGSKMYLASGCVAAIASGAVSSRELAAPLLGLLLAAGLLSAA